jgi:UDP-arabinose 4-epimerase
MQILVTGGAGYIGSHTCKLLAAAGHAPVVFDDLSQGHEWAVKWGPLEVGSMTNPAKYFANNTVGTFNLLQAMRAAKVGTIVFSSTCATYGNPVRVPIDETHPQQPVNPYGDSKLMVEKMLRWFGEAEGLRWIALRYFNAAGADSDGELGEEHDPESHLVPLVIGAALETRPPVKMFGTDYSTPDGTAIRDYIHVTDLADAHLRALDRLAAGTASQAINLGTGRGHSVREVVETVRAVGGRPVPVEQAARRAGDPPELVADPGRARSVLGWTPRYPELATIVEHAWAWHAGRT